MLAVRSRSAALGLVTALTLAVLALLPIGSASSATTGVSVANGALVRDGHPFLPRGFNMIGVLGPDGCHPLPAASAAARASFTDTELATAATTWHANLVRFQVSQRGLDQQDVMYRPSYLTRVQQAVALAERHGLAVILSMQDQSLGCGYVRPLPSAATLRAWSTLAPVFGGDPNVLFELYNEPGNPATAAGWKQWRSGGSGPVNNRGAAAVGHQAIVTKIRSLGARNVLIADGANNAGQLQGMPTLTDTLGTAQIARGVHPYYFHVTNNSSLTTDRANWDKRFGAVGGTGPVIATEWNATSANCTAGSAARIPDLLNYLESKNIGLLGHAFDVPHSMVKDLTTWAPTTMDGYGCRVVGPEAGALVQQRFTEQAARLG